MEDGGRSEQSSPLSFQAHPSVFRPRSLVEGGGGVSGSGLPVMFPGDMERERERTLALQALAQLGPHRLTNYHDLFLRGLLGGREVEAEDPGRTLSPAMQRDRWAEEEEMGEEEAEEGE